MIADEAVLDACAARLEDGLCPEPNCGRGIDWRQLGCKRHWLALPLKLRHLILRAWKNRVADPLNLDAEEEHEHWKRQAFNFWVSGTWEHPVQGGPQ